MNIAHATIWLDHTKACVLHFEDQRFPTRDFRKTNELQTCDGGGDLTRNLFRDLCATVEDVPQLLLTGTPAAIADFERYLAAEDVALARRIVGVQCLDKPAPRRLSALARWHFTKRLDGPGVAN